MEESLKLLVVDDDKLDRMALHRALQRSDLAFELQEANDATTGTALLNAQDFDCAFLDYRLPDADGLVLVNRLRCSGIDIPLIVLTGQGSEETAVNVMKAGASDYLPKSSLSSDALALAIRHAVRVYRAEQNAALANQHLRDVNELLKRKNEELRRQRTQIQRRNLQLVEVSRLKAEFLATMSHELKTPLSVIIGFSQVLMRQMKGRASDRQYDMVQRIFANGQNLLTLIDDILDFSKIEAGRLTLRSERVNVVELVTTAVESLRSLAELKSLDLSVTAAVDNPFVSSDSKRVCQIVKNLLSNAIEFTEVGSVSVTISEATPDRLKIIVEDSGIGIADKDVPHIFDALHQVDQTIVRKHKGTGLGLAITHLLVEMMQGEISVQSQLGQGSCFTVTLPRKM